MSALDPEIAALVEWRRMGPGDFALVMDSWSKGWRESPWSGVVPNNRWRETFVDAVAQLLARGAVIEVAGVKGRPDDILGYRCSERVRDGVALHYAYVKDPYRRRGLGSELVRRAEREHDEQAEAGARRRFFTHRTRDSGRVCPPDRWTHAPEVARRRAG